MVKFLIGIFAGALALAAANIDGTWVAEVQQRARGGETKKQQVTLTLKSSGSALSGSISAGRRGQGVEIQNGKVEGDKFSFQTVQKTKKGENKMNWTGSVSGDELKGERSREGARRAVSFTAKRQS
jgi:hypothetical protein